MRFISLRPRVTVSRIRPQLRLRNERMMRPVARTAVGSRGTRPVSAKWIRIGVARASLYGDVMIALTLDLDTAMADWVRDRNRMIFQVSIAVILVFALALTLNLALRQSERAEIERSRARATLDDAIESMSDGFVMWDREDRLVTCNEHADDTEGGAARLADYACKQMAAVPVPA